MLFFGSKLVQQLPSDYYLFLKMRKELSSHRFDRDGDVIAAGDQFLLVQDANLDKEGICLLHDLLD